MLYFQIVHTIYTDLRYTNTRSRKLLKRFFSFISLFTPLFVIRTHGCPPIRAFVYLKVNLGTSNTQDVDKK